MTVQRTIGGLELQVSLTFGFGVGFRFRFGFGPGRSCASGRSIAPRRPFALDVMMSFIPQNGRLGLLSFCFFGFGPSSTAALFGPGLLSFFGRRLFRGLNRSGNGREAFYTHFECAFNLRVQLQFDFVFAERFKRVIEMDFPLVEGNVELMFQFIRNHAGCDCPEHFAVFACFDFKDANQFLDAFGQFTHGVELVSFAIGAPLLERLDVLAVGLRQGDGETLGKKIIPGVAGGHFHLVGFGTQSNDVVREDDFSLHINGAGRAWGDGKIMAED